MSIVRAIPPSVTAGYVGAGKLKAVATAPGGSVLAAARYNSSGALEEVRLTEISDFCSARTFDTGIRRQEGCTCTVMLVSKAKFIPLCQAAEV